MKPNKKCEKIIQMSFGGTNKKTTWSEIREVLMAAQQMADALEAIKFEKGTTDIIEYNHIKLKEAKKLWGIK